jgi:hypothetical protein
MTEDRVLYTDIQAIADLFESGAIRAAVTDAIGPVV